MNFLKSAFVVSFFTFISRILGFVRDVLIAKYFGSSIFSDAFFTAFKLPNFFRKIFAEGAFNSAFVPLFSSGLATQEKKEIHFFANNIFSFLLYSLLLFTIIAEIFMPFFIKIIAPGFIGNAYKFGLTVRLAKIMFPYLLFISLISMMSGVLNSFNKFAVVSICPAILNISFIFAIFLATQIRMELAFALSWAVFIAGILQLLWLFFFTIKEGVILYPVLPKLGPNTKKFFSKFLHGAIGSGITQINIMVGSIIATIIPNAVSYLYYADRLVQFPLALIGTALGTGILPVLSKEIETGNGETASSIQEKALFVALLFGIPASVGLFYFAKLIISVLFERGLFVASDTIAVSRILKVYSIGLPAFISIKILQTIFFARKDTRTPMLISLVCLFVNVAFNLLLLKPFGYVGIAIATTIASFSNLFLLLWLLFKDKNFAFSEFFKVQVLKIFYCSILMLAVIISMDKLFFSYDTVLFKIKLIRLISIGAGGAICYFIIAHFIKLINMSQILRIARKG